MLSRTMSAELNEKIHQLELVLSEQRNQIEILQNQTQSYNCAEQQIQYNFDPTRIPDIIKMVPGYDGEIRSLPSWLDSISTKLECAKKLVPESALSTVLSIWTLIIR